MIDFRLIPYEENGELKFKKISFETFNSPEEYDKFIKKNKELNIRKDYHAKRIKIIYNKIKQPALYPTDNLWEEFIRIISEIYYERFWCDFKKDILILVRTLAIRD